MVRKNGSYRTGGYCFRNYSSEMAANYACSIVFLALMLGVLITMCIVRRRTGPGKRLIGLPYMFAAVFTFVQQVIDVVSSTLVACAAIPRTRDVYSWNIAYRVFSALQTFLLFFVVLWTLNTMLRKHLGHNPRALKWTVGTALVLLGCLLAIYVIIYCYLATLVANMRFPRWGFDYLSMYYVNIAFWALYLVSILGSGVLSLLAIRALQSKRVAGSSLMLWTSVIYTCLFTISLIAIIEAAQLLSPQAQIDTAGFVAMYWIGSLAQALAYFAVIAVAKDTVWRPNAYAAPVEQEYAAHGYQQEHVYDGAGYRA